MNIIMNVIMNIKQLTVNFLFFFFWLFLFHFTVLYSDLFFAIFIIYFFIFLLFIGLEWSYNTLAHFIKKNPANVIKKQFYVTHAINGLTQNVINCQLMNLIHLEILICHIFVPSATMTIFLLNHSQMRNL